MRVTTLILLLWVGSCLAGDEIWGPVFKFQLKLADEGFAAAQYKLAEMYEEGRGTEQDFEKAKYWYAKAAVQGFAGARTRIALVGKRNPALERSNDIEIPSNPALVSPEQTPKPDAIPATAPVPVAVPVARNVPTKKNPDSHPQPASPDPTDALRESILEDELQREIRSIEKGLSENAPKNRATVDEREVEQPVKQDRTITSAATGSQHSFQTQDSLPTALPGPIPVHAPVIVDDEAISTENGSAESAVSRDKPDPKFKSNPCEGPAARFMSTCR